MVTRVILVVILMGIFVGIALSFALPYSPGEASGWWQVVFAVIGLPVVVYQLKKIDDEIKRAHWKPEIRIGLANHPSSISNIKANAALPGEIDLFTGRNVDNFQFLLVIQNRGNLAAKSVKIHIEFTSIDQVDSRFIPKVWWFEDKRFEKQSHKDYIFHGGTDWVIYPHDIEIFEIGLAALLGLGDYIFNCTIWADGLDAPISAELTVKRKSQESRLTATSVQTM